MQEVEPRSGLLPYLGILRFTGADALAFLQGQVSNDTRILGEGRAMLAAFSSPQGRVLALLRLMPHAAGLIAILPRELLVPTLEALRRFVLRSKVKIEIAGPSLEVCGHHGASLLRSAGIPLPALRDGYVEHDGIGLTVADVTAGRYFVVGPPEKLAQYRLAGAHLPADRIEHDWRLADIRAGLPQIYPATREVFVAQMLNLDLLDGISFSKGCYTGQEIIARTQHLGRIKRRLYRLQLPEGDWLIGQALLLSDGRAGRIVEVARAPQGFEALAVLNLQVDPAADEAVPKTAVAGIPMPLPYSLS